MLISWHIHFSELFLAKNVRTPDEEENEFFLFSFPLFSDVAGDIKSWFERIQAGADKHFSSNFNISGLQKEITLKLYRLQSGD